MHLAPLVRSASNIPTREFLPTELHWDSLRLRMETVIHTNGRIGFRRFNHTSYQWLVHGQISYVFVLHLTILCPIHPILLYKAKQNKIILPIHGIEVLLKAITALNVCIGRDYSGPNYVHNRNSCNLHEVSDSDGKFRRVVYSP